MERRVVRANSLGVPKDEGALPGRLGDGRRHSGEMQRGSPAAWSRPSGQTDERQTIHVVVKRRRGPDLVGRCLRTLRGGDAVVEWVREPADDRPLAALVADACAIAPLPCDFGLVVHDLAGDQVVPYVLFAEGQRSGVRTVATVRSPASHLAQYVAVVSLPNGSLHDSQVVGSWLVRLGAGEHLLTFSLDRPDRVRLLCDRPFEPTAVNPDYLRARGARQGDARQPFYVACLVETTDDGNFAARLDYVSETVRHLVARLGTSRELGVALLACGDTPHTNGPRGRALLLPRPRPSLRRTGCRSSGSQAVAANGGLRLRRSLGRGSLLAARPVPGRLPWPRQCALVWQ